MEFFHRVRARFPSPFFAFESQELRGSYWQFRIFFEFWLSFSCNCATQLSANTERPLPSDSVAFKGRLMIYSLLSLILIAPLVVVTMSACRMVWFILTLAPPPHSTRSVLGLKVAGFFGSWLGIRFFWSIHNHYLATPEPFIVFLSLVPLMFGMQMGFLAEDDPNDPSSVSSFAGPSTLFGVVGATVTYCYTLMGMS